MEGQKQWKDITMVYETDPTNAATLLVTPEAGTAKSITMPVATPGRVTKTFPLDTNGVLMEGKSVVVKVTAAAVTTSKVILYSGYIRFRVVGEYLTNGEFWETQPLTFD